MSQKSPFRPWGHLEWAIGLTASRKWRFFGCIASEERSISALMTLHNMGLLESTDILRILDTEPDNIAAEDHSIKERLATCTDQKRHVQPFDIALDAPLQNAAWKNRFDFPAETSFCLDISSLPKRFFFNAIKAALSSENVRDLLVLYSKPTTYPDGPLSSNPNDWDTITGFGCIDPDKQRDAASHLVVGAGFAVDGLLDHLGGSGGGINVDLLIPFPAEPWSSVHRSWESARKIEQALGYDPDNTASGVVPSFHQVGALDASSCFDRLLSLTKNGTAAVTLAPLGPKPLSLAMCLLAAQGDHYPVYYAQPRSYALNYSSGFETTYAYWIKHDGVNLYAV